MLVNNDYTRQPRATSMLMHAVIRCIIYGHDGDFQMCTTSFIVFLFPQL
jgi:hypothetical protein